MHKKLEKRREGGADGACSSKATLSREEQQQREAEAEQRWVLLNP